MSKRSSGAIRKISGVASVASRTTEAPAVRPEVRRAPETVRRQPADSVEFSAEARELASKMNDDARTVLGLRITA